MAQSPSLLASYFTLAGNILPLAKSMASPIDLAERATAAASAGYRGIGLHIDDVVNSVDRLGYSGVRNLIADSGLVHLEIEALLDWFADGERRRNSDDARRLMLNAAEWLGAFQLKVVGDLWGGEWPVSKMAQEFAVLCRQAASAGINVVIEILPFSNIRDLATAAEIVGSAGAANGGLCLDIWHLARGGIPYEDIASIPAGFIKHVELDDGDATVVGTLLEDTVRNRRLPGEGSFDVPRFLRCIRATGYSGLYGVEVISDLQRTLRADQAATRTFNAAAALTAVAGD